MARKKKTIGWYIDRHYKLKQERDEIIRKLEAKKAEINDLADEALREFGKQDIQGSKGRNATGYIEEREVYKIADRRKLDTYIKRTGHLEILQSRVSPKAYEELLAQGKKPSGIEPFTVVSFRTRKR